MRSLRIKSFFTHPTVWPPALSSLPPLLLLSLTDLDVDVIGPCVSQLTALRSLRTRSLDCDCETLAPLTALTRLEVFADPHLNQWPAAEAWPAECCRHLPLLRTLYANGLVIALMHRPGSLPSLTELSCSPPIAEVIQARFAELVRRRLPTLASLSVRSWNWQSDHMQLGHPSELVGLTHLAAHSSVLSPVRGPLPAPVANPRSTLARLEVIVGPDCDPVELLRGLLSLTSLKLSCFHPPDMCRWTDRTLGRALGGLDALANLELAGLDQTVLAMLSAAAAELCVTARVKRLALRGPLTPEIAARVAAFPHVEGSACGMGSH